MNWVKAEVLFCDDIRIEQSGKHILIGVYPSDLVVPQIPFVLPVALWIRVHEMDAVINDAMIEIGYKDEVPFLKADVNFSNRSVDVPVVFPLPQIPVSITKPGILQVKLGARPDAMFEIGTLKVVPQWELQNNAQ